MMIDVTVDGQPYQEMHVDGGAVSQAFLYPPQLNVSLVSAEYGIKRERNAFIIRNSKLDADWASTERQTLDIIGRAISSLIQSQGVGDLDRMYIQTQRDDVPGGGDFDPVYMNALFDHGYALGKAGYVWYKQPPGFAE
jgi:hypothetical protein